MGLLESPCECGIEPPGSISHGVGIENTAGSFFSWPLPPAQDSWCESGGQERLRVAKNRLRGI